MVGIINKSFRDNCSSSSRPSGPCAEVRMNIFLALETNEEGDGGSSDIKLRTPSEPEVQALMLNIALDLACTETDSSNETLTTLIL